MSTSSRNTHLLFRYGQCLNDGSLSVNLRKYRKFLHAKILYVKNVVKNFEKYSVLVLGGRSMVRLHLQQLQQL